MAVENQEKNAGECHVSCVQSFLTCKFPAAERHQILEWISPLNSFQRQVDIFSTSQPVTGQWLLTNPIFKEWQDGSGQVLWCRGIPGAGKTVLASLVIHHLADRAADARVAWVYLNHKETEIQTPANVLGVFLKQLALKLNFVPAGLESLYKHHTVQQTTPKCEEIINVFPSVITKYRKMTLVIDALDEYPEVQRHILIEFLATLGSNVNLMITSRPHINLDSCFPEIQVLNIEAADSDVYQYVHTQILKSARLSKHVKAQPTLHTEILDKVVHNAQGMFLLAKLHMDALTKKLTIRAVQDALTNLPKDLNQTYDEAMQRINNQPEEERQLAYLVLMWVANSKRPLLVAELQEALTIEPDSTELDTDNILDLGTILSVCAGLVITDDTMSGVCLIHYTTQHYLDCIQPQQFPTDIAQRCFIYLQLIKPPTEWQSLLIDEHPFVQYSQHCLLHAVGEPEIELQPEIRGFLKCAYKWVHCFWSWYDAPRNSESFLLPLWICARFNLCKTITHLLAEETFQNGLDYALNIASDYGHLQMVQVLVKRGGGVNTRFGGKTPLYVASAEGHSCVVELKGADPNAEEGGEFRTSLLAAISGGHESVVKVLLKNGANVNDYTPAIRTIKSSGGIVYELPAEAESPPLITALENGHLVIADLLIENGANLNIANMAGRTAIWIAVSRTPPEDSLIELLINKGADVNSVGKKKTLLTVATEGGHLSTAKLLIDRGAKVNVPKLWATPLQGAASSGHYLVAQLLIDKRADISARGDYYRREIDPEDTTRLSGYATALQAAAGCGHTSIIELLIEKGADINQIEQGRYGTALHAAAEVGRKSVTECLLMHGANVNIRGEWCETPLHRAVAWGWYNLSHLQMLIDHGADINAPGDGGRTVIQTAIRKATVAAKKNCRRRLS
ncbi:ankyrin repeat-containing domain protein [Mycena polygramma]|nr:ankyrin repeat-containing domain protein [Mycena polygramma]